MFLLTDGTVLFQDQGPEQTGSSNWWKLTPDSNGNYVDGTWRRMASLPANYSPLYYSSAVLPDGRFIIEGGEYNLGPLAWTNRGAVYDPVANTWKEVSPPDGGAGEWSRIGDAPGTVLADGTYMVGASGYSTTTVQALLNEKQLTWKSTGTGKADGNGEEGWSLLPNGDVLTVDTSRNIADNSEIYSPSSGSWTSAGRTPNPLYDNSQPLGEIGPQILMPKGAVFAEGASQYTAVYNVSSRSWTAGPNFPVIDGTQYTGADGSSAVLPNGDVLFDVSPDIGVTPTHFLIFDGTSFSQVPDPPDASDLAVDYVYFLDLPNGQVLMNGRIGSSDSLYVYNPTGPAKPSWLPRIAKITKVTAKSKKAKSVTKLARGHTYVVSGAQLNGLTGGSAEGDDFQDATNYPIVRIKNDQTKSVVYARTIAMTSMSVAPGKSSTADFKVPANAPRGESTIAVVANGISSAPMSVKIK